ncbi:hypothetical protein DPSP01_013386 [Paraphaeosphaeria sporulosa]
MRVLGYRETPSPEDLQAKNDFHVMLRLSALEIHENPSDELPHYSFVDSNAFDGEYTDTETETGEHKFPIRSSEAEPLFRAAGRGAANINGRSPKPFRKNIGIFRSNGRRSPTPISHIDGHRQSPHGYAGIDTHGGLQGYKTRSAEPINRINGRSADPGTVRGPNKRAAEPTVRGPRSTNDDRFGSYTDKRLAEPFTRAGTGRRSDAGQRDVLGTFNSMANDKRDSGYLVHIAPSRNDKRSYDPAETKPINRINGRSAES